VSFWYPQKKRAGNSRVLPKLLFRAMVLQVLALGLETSGQPGSVAVVNEHGVLAHCTYAQPNRHAELLLEQIETVLRAARCSKGDLARIAVGTGPGNFTGLRVGIALASGIGLGLRIQVVGVSSLASLAAAVQCPESPVRIVVRDARRDEVFAGVFSAMGDPLLSPSLIPTSQLHAWLAAQLAHHVESGKGISIAGDGLQWLNQWQRAELAAYVPAAAESITPDARCTAQIGLRQSHQPAVAAEYLRDADAKVPDVSPSAVLDKMTIL